MSLHHPILLLLHLILLHLPLKFLLLCPSIKFLSPPLFWLHLLLLLSLSLCLSLLSQLLFLFLKLVPLRLSRLLLFAILSQNLVPR